MLGGRSDFTGHQRPLARRDLVVWASYSFGHAMTTVKPPRRGVPLPLPGGPQRFGSYQLEARLSVGTRSEVFLAQPADDERLDTQPDIDLSRIDTTSTRLVAMKRILPHLVGDTNGCALFAREARFLGAVTHANVVRAVASGTTDLGEPFLAMEYVDGRDLMRLMHEALTESAAWPVGLAVFVVREILAGLSSVHAARDEAGASLDLMHRDVTPSNLFVSRAGDVKLGDFGLARSIREVPDSRGPDDSRAEDASLMGKWAYLAPEQVAGDTVDVRADLFAVATILTELVVGQPLFSGTNQLQVLLAIRDCTLTPLHEARARARLPAPFTAVLEKALAREPAKRFPDAASLSAALAPFAEDARTARRELAARVLAAQDAHDAVATGTEPAVGADASLNVTAERESVRDLEDEIENAMTPTLGIDIIESSPALTDELFSLDLDLDLDEELALEDDAHLRATGSYPQLEAFVERRDGERSGPWTFARLVEAIASGLIRRGDQVGYVGGTPKPIEQIKELARLLPPAPDGDRETAVPSEPSKSARVSQAGDAPFTADLSATTMVDVLAHMLARRQTGLLVLERDARSPGGVDGAESVEHREVFLLRGRVHHVSGGNTAESLGDFLVRRGKLAREELDLALAVLPRYGGRIGDTLIALGLVDGVDIFRAIREQGRDAMIDLFRWTDGTARIEPGVPTPAVDFPLDLDLPTLMLAGMEASHPGDAPVAFIEGRLDDVVAPNTRADLASFAWPPLVTTVLGALVSPVTLRDLMGAVTKSATVSAADAIRGLELVLAMDLARWQ